MWKVIKLITGTRVIIVNLNQNHFKKAFTDKNDFVVK